MQPNTLYERPETRERRIREVVERAETNRKLGWERASERYGRKS